MKPILHTFAALCLAHASFLSPARAADAGAEKLEAALAAVNTLAEINGVALACQEMTVAARAKQLMLAHAPKTLRFGAAFEDTTHASYLAQTASPSACPNATALGKRLDEVTLRLTTTLPVKPVQAQ